MTSYTERDERSDEDMVTIVLRLEMTVDVLFKIKVFAETHHHVTRRKCCWLSTMPQSLVFVPNFSKFWALYLFFGTHGLHGFWSFQVSFDTWIFLVVRKFIIMLKGFS